MFVDSRYVDRIPQIRAELVMRAKCRETISYTLLGRVVAMPKQGPWNGVLDHVSGEELAAGRPDITHLVINMRTGISSRVEYHDAFKPTVEQRARWKEITEECFTYYADKDVP